MKGFFLSLLLLCIASPQSASAYDAHALAVKPWWDSPLSRQWIQADVIDNMRAASKVGPASIISLAFIDLKDTTAFVHEAFFSDLIRDLKARTDCQMFSEKSKEAKSAPAYIVCTGDGKLSFGPITVGEGDSLGALSSLKGRQETLNKVILECGKILSVPVPQQTSLTLVAVNKSLPGCVQKALSKSHDFQLVK